MGFGVPDFHCHGDLCAIGLLQKNGSSVGCSRRPNQGHTQTQAKADVFNGRFAHIPMEQGSLHMGRNAVAFIFYGKAGKFSAAAELDLYMVARFGELNSIGKQV